MSRKKSRSEIGNLSSKSEAERLKDRLVAEKGKKFERLNFFPLDAEGLILERIFHETGEIVCVHLSPHKRIQAVYLTYS